MDTIIASNSSVNGHGMALMFLVVTMRIFSYGNIIINVQLHSVTKYYGNFK